MTDFIERGNENFFVLNKLNRYLKLAGPGGFIAGGAIRDLLTGKAPRDIDIFFRTEAEFNTAKASVTKDAKRQIYENKRAVGYLLDNGGVVELIRHRFGSPAELLEDFDFTITKAAYWAEEKDGETIRKVLHHPDYFEHIQQRRLVIDGNLLQPINSFERTYKYAKYGFRLCRDSKVTLLRAIQGAPEATVEALSASLYEGWD